LVASERLVLSYVEISERQRPIMKAKPPADGPRSRPFASNGGPRAPNGSRCARSARLCRHDTASQGKVTEATPSMTSLWLLADVFRRIFHVLPRVLGFLGFMLF
jgi:hypothetical protein